MASVFEVQEADARRILKELSHTNAGSIKIDRVRSSFLEEVEGIDEDEVPEDLSTKSKKIFEKAMAAIADDKKIKIVAMNGHADEDEDEEEEKPKRSAKKAPVKKAKAKKKAADDDDDDEEDEPVKKTKKKPAAKEKKKRGGGGGASNKDRVFDIWVADPVKAKKTLAKIAAKFPEVLETTIKSWMSAWGRNQNLPRGAKGRDREIKAAIKKLKAA